MIRLFAALPVPAPARDEVAALLREVRELPWPVRWVSESGIHLTLKFYGDVNEERLDPIAESIGFATAGTGSLALGLGELGAFPNWEKARVLWAGIEAPPALELLQDRVERHAESLGFAVEGAAFRPHVTLGRVREGERLSAPAAAQLQQRALDAAFSAEEVVLFESRQGGRFPDYVPLRTFPLTA